MNKNRYRVFDSENNEMRFECGIDPNGIAFSYLGADLECLIEPDFFPNDEADQCLGVKDKNKKFIYENDIMTGGLLVEWIQNDCSYKVGNYWASKSYLSSKEIIGNIHQNPELLKDT